MSEMDWKALPSEPVVIEPSTDAPCDLNDLARRKLEAMLTTAIQTLNRDLFTDADDDKDYDAR